MYRHKYKKYLEECEIANALDAALVPNLENKPKLIFIYKKSQTI